MKEFKAKDYTMIRVGTSESGNGKYLVYLKSEADANALTNTYILINTITLLAVELKENKSKFLKRDVLEVVSSKRVRTIVLDSYDVLDDFLSDMLEIKNGLPFEETQYYTDMKEREEHYESNRLAIKEINRKQAELLNDGEYNNK